MFDVYNVETNKITNKHRLPKKNPKTENNISYTKTIEDLQLNLLNNSVSTSPITSSESFKSALYLLSPDKSLTLSNSSNPEKSPKSKEDSNELLGKKKKRLFFNVINNTALSSSENRADDKLTNNSNSENLNSDFNDNITDQPKNIKKRFRRTLHKDKNLNEGRWTLEEHVKFVEAIIQYGKDWKEVQKLVGSRSSAQARSHAQKFFLKLKTVKLPELSLDFTDDNIKNLQNMIDLIENFEKITYGFSDKVTTINILLNLSEQYFRDKTKTKNEKFEVYKTQYITEMTSKENLENLEIAQQKIEENKLKENLEKINNIVVKTKSEIEIAKILVKNRNNNKKMNIENEKKKKKQKKEKIEKEDNKTENKKENNFSIHSSPSRNQINNNNEDNKNDNGNEEPIINLDMQRIIYWDDDYKFNNLEDYFLVNVPRSIKKYLLNYNPDKISLLNSSFYS